jgi:hypothetical protein
VPGPRYAIYYVPPAQSDLFRFGSSVLGYDCHSGRPVERPAAFSTEHDLWDRLTAEPRRYGFHATLKAPFRLRDSTSEAQLKSALHSFAALGHAVAELTPNLEFLGDFIAIVPALNLPAANALASNCTTIFDAFRAPMSAQERARRVASGLNRSQIENLDRWGYPYLFSDFRFHLTLTGTVATRLRNRVLIALRREFERACGERTIAIDRIALMRQDRADAFFRVVDEADLRLAS